MTEKTDNSFIFGHTAQRRNRGNGGKINMKAGRIGAATLALCAAAGVSMLTLSGSRKAEYCSLAEYHGRVAIFAPDERTLPRQITAIAVHTLPSADREALFSGIAVYSREELYARLEDFGS